jgi:hypothetical protein
MRKSLFLLLASFALAGTLCAQVTYNAVTDQVYRPLPPTPPMGPAGTIVNDPTYGNPILRVTDSNTLYPGSGEGCVTPATAMLNNWNSNDTLFFVYCKGMTVVPFDFDPVAMKATRHGNMTLNMVSPSFSFNDPNLIYGPNGNDSKIYQYNFATNQYTPIFDLTTAGATTGGTGATSISADDHFSVDFNGIQDVRNKVLWLDLKSGNFKVLDTTNGTVNGKPVSSGFDGQPLPFGIHLVNMDKSGRYLVISKGNNSQGPNLLVWDTATDTFAHVRDYPTGHYSLGWGQLVNGNGFYPYYMQWMWRPFSNMSNPVHLVRPEVVGPYGDKEEHTSWNNAQPNVQTPVITCLTRDSWSSNGPGPWDDEIIGIGTDPSTSVVYRFGHSFALFDNTNFWDLPRGNVSPDGRFYMFTSNWRRTLENSEDDTFIIKLPLNGSGTTPPPTPAPPPTLAQTTTSLNAPGSATQGQAVTMTASVSPSSATGTIAFMDGNTQLASVPLAAGAASFTASSLAVGQHSITAVYSGDSADAGSTSPAVNLTVTAPVTTPPSAPAPASSPSVTLNAMLTLAADTNPAVGAPVNFTVTMKPACASGTVAFSDGGTVLARANVTGGGATYSTSSLSAGSHSITATFSGDGDFAGSQAAATVTITVGSGSGSGTNNTPPSTTVPVSSGPNLLVNASFENGTNGWTNWQNAAIDTSVAYQGNASVRTTSGGTVVQRVRCYAGVPYMLTVWAKSNNATSYTAMVWRDASGNVIRTDQLPVVSGTSDWAPLNLWVWAPYGTYSADILLGAANGSAGSVWFDQAQFGVK